MFRKKCPGCRSTNVQEPETILPGLYIMSPMICRECGFKFEPWLPVRVAFWILLAGMAIFGVFIDILISMFGKSLVSVVVLPFIIVGFITMFALSAIRQHQEWSENYRVRKAVNYGALGSFVILGIVFVIKKYYF
jgi:hypothetical protein